MKFIPRIALAATLSATAPLAAHAQQTQVFASDERSFQEGLELFDHGKYGAAQQAFQRYLELTQRRTGELAPGRTVDAEYYYAVSGLYLFHPDAEDRILAFASQNPAHPKAAVAFFELGKFYFDKKDYAKATDYLQRVGADNLSGEQRAEAEFKLGYSYFAQKEFDKAKLQFDRNKQGQHEYRYASSYYAGYLAYRAGDYAGARKDLAVAEQNDAYRPVVPAVMSQIYYKEGDFDGLITYGTNALAQTPPPQSADEIQLLVGDAYYQKQDFKSAATYFDKYAAGRKKIEPAVQYKIGYANYKQGDFKGAIGSFKTVAVRRDSLGQNAAYHLGLSYLQTNQKQLALNSFDAARKLGYDRNISENAALKYAQVQYELGNTPEVIAALKDFNKKFPRSKNRATADDILSESFLNSSDYTQALNYLDNLDDRSTKLNATYQRVAYLQAATLYNNARYTEALPLLDKSLKYPQDDALRAAAQVLKGEIYSVGQKYPEAITAYTAAARTARQGGVDADEKDFEQKARYGLGYAYYNTQQYERARPQFQAWLQDPVAKPADPNYYDVTLRLADTYYVAKNYQQALDLYNKVITANAADKDYAYYQKSVVLGLLGRRDEANSTLSTLLKTSPTSRYADDAVYQQAQLDFEAGSFQQAVDGFSKLITNRPNSALLPQALQKRGVAYANLEQHEKAVADFKQVLSAYPRTKAASSAIYSLQESLSELGRTEEFDQYLAQFKQQNPDNKATESVEFEAAKSLYLAEKYAQAIPRLESYLKQYPDNALAADGRYFLADALLKTGKKAEALPKLKAVAQEGKSEFVNRAVGRVAELEFENKNYPEAIKYYSRLREVSQNKREVANAGLGLMKSYYESADYEGTRRVAAELQTQAASPAATNAALLYLGKASLKTGNLDQAITELNNAATTAAADENGAEALYLVADALFQQKKYNEALDAAYKTNASNYELWQGRGFLLIADIYAAQGETFQARATLNSIIDNKFPVAEIIDGAKKRLAALPAEAPAGGTKTTTPKPTTTKPGATKTPPATKGKTAGRSSLVPSTEQPSDTVTNRTDGPIGQEE
ncbi:tetratricopeptide repeat protein [Hymenobacter sp. BT186]|uniref:Tetratricopeptide repeat protein n=1 Tax=Hymenobacter telluris TaxID=2816474 RepID=A0A939EWI9_9BACT|nr:tetratricopeptide repeat protein [Hymenobacter telluris]MBO0358489.1 tetratricopeptide repeat protein [Hymenobacter telluris]MBW3374515.1 tetratricopeptide repeat protein [Hymenobacter norwichensis]